MKISIVIPAFNEERLLGETLIRVKLAMSAFVDLGWESELVVCDNNSSDRTADIAREAGAIVAFEPLNQIARARNCGAAHATGDWLVFIDADSHPSAELFADVAREIKSGKCLAGGSTVVLEKHNHRFANVVVRLWNAISRTGRLVAGSFIFCDAKAFRQIGGFNEKLYAGEEIELSKRLKRLAHKTGRRIVILHRHPLVTSARKMHLYTRGEHLRFVLKTIVGGGRTLNSREACHTWYDGRR